MLAPVRVTVAAGPFCTHANLDYRPLEELLRTVSRNGTDVLVLLGPFVDASHPVVSEGTLNVTYEELWKEKLQRIVNHVVDHNVHHPPGKRIQRVVLVPSLLDMHHAAVFPQFPLHVDSVVASLPREHRDLVVSVPNPTVLRINGVSFGFTSVDPLRHMCGSIYGRRPEGHGLSLRLEAAAHLVEQQSFVPMQPLPADVPLDSAHLAHAEFGEETPQVLVLPSLLEPFADVVKGALVVNPSTLVRGKDGGGCYCELTLYPKPSEDALDEGEGAVPMDEEGFSALRRVGVRVVKI